VNDIVDILFKNDKLTEREMTKIKKKKKKSITRMARRLLKILGYKDSSAYYWFLEALKETNQVHLYNLLVIPGRLILLL